MEIIWTIVVLALIFETLDSAAAMGFGTAFAPVLFSMGYSPVAVVPVLLISECITGLTDGIFDHTFKNANFSLRPLSPAAKISFLIAGTGCMGIIVSTLLFFQLPTQIIKIYSYLLVIIMGLIGLANIKRKSSNFKPKLLGAFAVVAGFNKGIGGGGFGPVVTLGQIFSGVYEKVASATTSWGEGFVSLLGASILLSQEYLASAPIHLQLLPSVFSGAFFAAILAPYLTRVIPNRVWRVFMPLYALSIGIFSLLNLFVL
jgi:hypothetical protein